MSYYINSSNNSAGLTKEQFAMRIIEIGLKHGIPDTEIRQYYGNTLVNKYLSRKSQETLAN